MADSSTQSRETGYEKGDQKKLKHLEFVHVAAIQALVFLASLCEFAKENSGPLKSGFNSVVGTVKSVIGPLYEKFHGVPFEVLRFVDVKVDKLLCEIDQHTPSILKKAQTVAHKATELAHSVISEVQRSGVVAAAKGIAKDAYVQYEPKAKELYNQYEPVAEQYAVVAWQSLNRLPLFSQVAQIVVPTAAHWSEKYNKAVQSAKSEGYSVAQYMPLVPVERIAKVFTEDGRENTVEPTAAASE